MLRAWTVAEKRNPGLTILANSRSIRTNSFGNKKGLLCAFVGVQNKTGEFMGKHAEAVSKATNHCGAAFFLFVGREKSSILCFLRRIFSTGPQRALEHAFL
jgi:hypothetical protein